MLSTDLETTVATAELVLVVTPSHAFGDVLRPSDEDFAHRVAQRLHSPSFRAYTGTDVVGAELGGAMKYVLAVATGTADGIKLGLNARAGLIARGLNEMLRLAAALGGKPERLMGLAGVGDLA